MGRFANEAKQHADKIEHYYNHGGTAGFAQADYHWRQLQGLISKASSAKDKSDVLVIKLTIVSAEPKMAEMKARANTSPVSQASPGP